MTSEELIELLKDYKGFEIQTSISYADGSSYGLAVDSFKLKGISDIGHSSKVICLDFDFSELEDSLSKIIGG